MAAAMFCKMAVTDQTEQQDNLTGSRLAGTESCGCPHVAKLNAHSLGLRFCQLTTFLLAIPVDPWMHLQSIRELGIRRVRIECEWPPDSLPLSSSTAHTKSSFPPDSCKRDPLDWKTRIPSLYMLPYALSLSPYASTGTGRLNTRKGYLSTVTDT